MANETQNSVEAFFLNIAKEEEQSSKARSNFNNADDNPEGSLLDLCYKGTRGTSILRPISDSNGYPLRIVNNCWDVYEVFPVYDANGNVRTNEDGSQWKVGRHTFVMPADNYKCQLTPTQIQLQAELATALDKYYKLSNVDELIDPEDPRITTQMNVAFRSKITFFWAKVLSHTVPGQGCIISDKVVRLCRHHGTSFRTDLTESISAKTAMKGGDGTWQEAFFNRSLGEQTSVMSCTVTMQQGFKNTIQFEDYGPKYEVTERDLEIATDLFSVGDNASRPTITGLVATVYPEQEMRDLLNRVNGYLNMFSSGIEIQPDTNGIPHINTAPMATAQQPAVQNVVQPTPTQQMPNIPTVDFSQIQPANPQNPVQPTVQQPVAQNPVQMVQQVVPNPVSQPTVSPVVNPVIQQPVQQVPVQPIGGVVPPMPGMQPSVPTL